MIRRALKVFVVLFVAATVAMSITLAIAVFSFRYPTEVLSNEAGGPLVITDRNGRVLRRTVAVDGRPGREAWVDLGQMRSHAVLAVLASEDEGFFSHHGVDPYGIMRAAWLNIVERRIGYGGSTITMQLVRMIHSPSQGRTFANKVKEAILALRMERDVEKHEILEQYLNRAYYGSGAYGLEAAAQTYFGKPAAALSTGEATLLAIVPRSPRLYQPARNLPRALKRRDHVLGLLENRGLMTPNEVKRARSQTVKPVARRPQFEAPHFCDWVVATLPDQVRKQGGSVRTSLDLNLQKALEHRLKEHVDLMRSRGMSQAGMVVLDTVTGEVLAMVGSKEFLDKDGQINITTRRRHPGSALKPFVYALALEEGDTPASIAYDIHEVPSRYRLKKVTVKERGPVRYREALAGSYNLAAVHVLEKVGEEKLVSRLRTAGVGEVPGDPRDYGLRLALGATRVRLVDLAAGYGFLVRDGYVTRPAPVIEVVTERAGIWRPEAIPERRVFSSEVSWLVMDMLSDPEARRPMFGNELPVDDMSFQVAFKTGTSRGFADTVAVGVADQLTVAAWAGNFDGKPTEGVVAMDGAAPLVRAGLMIGASGRGLTLPNRPNGIVAERICPLSGKPSSADCPHTKLEYFERGRIPEGHCDWHAVEGDRLVVNYPREASRWAANTANAAGRTLR